MTTASANGRMTPNHVLRSLPDASAYSRARLAATEYRMAERLGQKIDQQFGAWERHGVVIPDYLAGWREIQTAALATMKRECQKRIAVEWGDTAIGEFVRSTVGLGPALLLVLSLTKRLSDYPNPAKMWKHIGLGQDRASNRKYNAQLKAWCLFRLAEPCVKKRTSPYRAVYDRRRDSRPEMLPAGECEYCDAAYAKRKQTGKAGWDCHNMGGPHYKAMHARVDALGVTAKAITLDAWRVGHGLQPRHGGATTTVATINGLPRGEDA